MGTLTALACDGCRRCPLRAPAHVTCSQRGTDAQLLRLLRAGSMGGSTAGSGSDQGRPSPPWEGPRAADSRQAAREGGPGAAVCRSSREHRQRPSAVRTGTGDGRLWVSPSTRGAEKGRQLWSRRPLKWPRGQLGSSSHSEPLQRKLPTWYFFTSRQIPIRFANQSGFCEVHGLHKRELQTQLSHWARPATLAQAGPGAPARSARPRTSLGFGQSESTSVTHFQHAQLQHLRWRNRCPPGPGEHSKQWAQLVQLRYGHTCE